MAGLYPPPPDPSSSPRQFKKEGIPVASAHTKRCSPSLIPEVRTQTSNRCSQTRLATIKQQNHSKGGRGCEQTSAFAHCWGWGWGWGCRAAFWEGICQNRCKATYTIGTPCPALT